MLPQYIHLYFPSFWINECPMGRWRHRLSISFWQSRLNVCQGTSNNCMVVSTFCRLNYGIIIPCVRILIIISTNIHTNMIPWFLAGWIIPIYRISGLKILFCFLIIRKSDVWSCRFSGEAPLRQRTLKVKRRESWWYSYLTSNTRKYSSPVRRLDIRRCMRLDSSSLTE